MGLLSCLACKILGLHFYLHTHTHCIGTVKRNYSTCSKHIMHGLPVSCIMKPAIPRKERGRASICRTNCDQQSTLCRCKRTCVCVCVLQSSVLAYWILWQCSAVCVHRADILPRMCSYFPPSICLSPHLPSYSFFLCARMWCCNSQQLWITHGNCNFRYNLPWLLLLELIIHNTITEQIFTCARKGDLMSVYTYKQWVSCQFNHLSRWWSSPSLCEHLYWFESKCLDKW